MYEEHFKVIINKKVRVITGGVRVASTSQRNDVVAACCMHIYNIPEASATAPCALKHTIRTTNTLYGLLFTTAMIYHDMESMQAMLYSGCRA